MPFEMDQILSFFLGFLMMLSPGAGDCYELEIYNTFEDNGLLAVRDIYGNGADYYIEENRINVGVSKGPIYPFDKVVEIEGDGFFVYMYEFLKGDSSTHSVFEEEAFKLAHEIAQGGQDATHRSNCSNDSLWTWDLVWESQR
jgi:hypothetical protein